MPRAVFSRGEKMQLTYSVRNTHRAVGTRLSSEITRTFGMDKLADGHVHVRLRGSAGQSLGAFLCKGITLEVFGDANDYVGKGLSGGTIVVRPVVSSPLLSQENTIIGNTVLYGATSGRLFAAGQAGERFAVRNSGATVVVEGCGANGCEYMTNGIAVVLGPGRRQFRRGHDRRDGVRLRRERELRASRQWRLDRLAAAQLGALGGGAQEPRPRACRRDRQRLVALAARRLEPRARRVLASRAQRNARPAGHPLDDSVELVAAE